MFRATAIAGTVPTLNIYLQDRFTVTVAGDSFGNQPGGAYIYRDYGSLGQLTTTPGEAFFRYQAGIGGLVGTGAAMYFGTDAQLAAANFKVGPIGRAWRLKWVVAGTNPIYTCDSTVTFIP